MEQQGPETGEQKRRRDIESGDQRDYYRSSEHSKHVLQTQHDHFRGSQFARVIDRALTDFIFVITHCFFLLQFLIDRFE